MVNEPEEAIRTQKGDASQGQSQGGAPGEARHGATQGARYMDDTKESENFAPHRATQTARSPTDEGQTQDASFTTASSRCEEEAGIANGEEPHQARTQAQQGRTKETYGEKTGSIHRAEAGDEDCQVAHNHAEKKPGESSQSQARFICETTTDRKDSRGSGEVRVVRASHHFGF